MFFGKTQAALVAAQDALIARLEDAVKDWKTLALSAIAENRELKARLLPPLPEPGREPGERRTTRDGDTKAVEAMRPAKTGGR